MENKTFYPTCRFCKQQTLPTAAYPTQDAADAVNKIDRPKNSIIKIDLNLSAVIGSVANQQNVKIEIIPQEAQNGKRN